MNEYPGTGHLEAQALAGLRVGISISDSGPDLARLGLSWIHLEHAMREVVRTILVSGGTLAFGGDLRDSPDSLTTPMMDEVERYAQVQTDPDAPQERKALSLCLAWHIHRKVSKIALQRTRANLGVHGSIIYLDMEGKELPPRAQWADRPVEGVSEEPAADIQASGLSSMRRFMVSHTQARVLLGGKRLPRSPAYKSGYTGTVPGLIEEALLQLQACHPVYLAGGFGGITLDLIDRVDKDAAADLMDHGVELTTEAEKALVKFGEHCAAKSWSALNNGLTVDENRRLAHTHRPGEIAVLVALGLGRWNRTQGNHKPPHPA